MRKVICSVLVVLLLLTALLPLGAAAATNEALETTVSYPAKTYFYQQLPSNAKLIYDALAAEVNLPSLKAGEPISVAERSVNIPSGLTQTQFDTLYGDLQAKADELGVIMESLSDAVAAFYRDRTDIFWTAGVSSRLAYYEDGEPMSGELYIETGHTYTVKLQVMLPLGEDWDGDSITDRDLEADIEALAAGIRTIANAANALESRKAKVDYINEQLCFYNTYNTPAAEGSFGFRYPWTALSALDQLTVENDGIAAALRPVCEGYAKAFKMICAALNIPCILVSGTGDGEGHMWNYVQMEDNLWYAVDVTWNDSTGHNGYLLVGKDVMDLKHTTASNFMQGDHMTFYYPVLQDLSYTEPQSGLILEITADGSTEVTVGYTAAPGFALTIRNVGTDAEEITSVSVNEDHFIVSGPTTLTLNGGDADEESYRVSLASGLAAGSYSATITVTYGEDKTAIATVFATVLAPVLDDDEKNDENGDTNVKEPIGDLAKPDGEEDPFEDVEGLWQRLLLKLKDPTVKIVLIVIAAVLLLLLIGIPVIRGKNR